MDGLRLDALRHFQVDDFLLCTAVLLAVASNPSRFRSCLVIDRDVVNNRRGGALLTAELTLRYNAYQETNVEEILATVGSAKFRKYEVEHGRDFPSTFLARKNCKKQTVMAAVARDRYEIKL